MGSRASSPRIAKPRPWTGRGIFDFFGPRPSLCPSPCAALAGFAAFGSFLAIRASAQDAGADRQRQLGGGRRDRSAVDAQGLRRDPVDPEPQQRQGAAQAGPARGDVRRPVVRRRPGRSRRWRRSERPAQRRSSVRLLRGQGGEDGVRDAEVTQPGLLQPEPAGRRERRRTGSRGGRPGEGRDATTGPGPAPAAAATAAPAART